MAGIAQSVGCPTHMSWFGSWYLHRNVMWFVRLKLSSIWIDDLRYNRTRN